MRAVAYSVWIFINLAFLGMGGYVYLIVSTYWCRKVEETHVQPFIRKAKKFDRENQVVFYHQKELFQESKNSTRMEMQENVATKGDHRVFAKRIFRSRRMKALKKDCGVNCTSFNNGKETEIEKFKNDLFIRLRRVMHEESNVFKTDNPYFVKYKGPRGRYQGMSPGEIKCQLKSAGLRLLSKNDSYYVKDKFGEFFEGEEFLNGKHLETCAVVSSAGSLLNSKLGYLIDKHNIVVRFNHAPTKGYEEDVGSKTTIRLVNSQVVSKKEFNFTTSPLYRNVTLVVWDPSNYSSTLQQWYEKPDFDFFELWAKQKRLNTKKDSFVLDPRSVWNVWDFIQSLTALRIRRNPPSSGFLGLTLLLPYCDTVDFFEFVPSVRLTKKCHYFDDIEDDSCTFGVWHPLSAEKMLSLAMNQANDTTVFETGFIRVSGYKNLKC